MKLFNFIEDSNVLKRVVITPTLKHTHIRVCSLSCLYRDNLGYTPKYDEES